MSIVKAFALAAALFAATATGAWAQASLINAVQAGDTDQALQLIRQGADVNAPQADGTTALIWAAHTNQPALVKRLLKAGASVDAVNEYGASAMSQAAIQGSADVLALLLDAGADANSANPEGETALMAVARTGHVGAARLLIKKGADVNASEHWGGQTALMWAAVQHQPEMMQLLIDSGANVDAKGKARIWKRRITSEPRPKDMNKGGFSPLLYAAREGCLPCVKVLHSAGADLNSYDPDRVTALSLALLNLHFDVAQYLIEAGADIEKWDIFGRTPLYMAVDMSSMPQSARGDIPPEDKATALDIVTMLLDRGADPDVQLKMRPPYRQAVFDRRSDHILQYGATPLFRAAKASDNAVIKLLLAHGARVDLPNVMGITPLMVTAGLGHVLGDATRGKFKTQEEGIESLKLLLAAGADINHRSKNYKGEYAATEDERSFFNDYPWDGQTALHGAAKNGWTDVAQYLIDNGADLQVPDVNKRTAMDLALGKYDPAYLKAPPQPIEPMVELLRKACEARAGCQLPEDVKAF